MVKSLGVLSSFILFVTYVRIGKYKGVLNIDVNNDGVPELQISTSEIEVSTSTPFKNVVVKEQLSVGQESVSSSNVSIRNSGCRCPVGE